MKNTQLDECRINWNKQYDLQENQRFKETENYTQVNSPTIRSKDKNKENMWEMVKRCRLLQKYSTWK